MQDQVRFCSARFATVGKITQNGGSSLMTAMNISVPDEMKAFVEAQMAEEGYASASEYLRALIRDAQKRRAKQELEAKLLEGLHGPVTEMTRDEWKSIERQARDGLRGEKIRP
jgi:antitoxin ParD1/3/4